MTTIQGGLQKVWIDEETTYGEDVAMTSADSVLPIKPNFKIEKTKAFEESKEAHGSPSLVDEIGQGETGKFSGQFYIKPSALGVAPVDVGKLLKAALGTETIAAAASTTYSFSDSHTNSLRAVHDVTDTHQQLANGIVIEELSIEASGKSPPTISVSGSYAESAWCHKDQVGVGGVDFGETTIPIDDASIGCVNVGARICFANDDGGTAATITSVNAQNYDFSAEGDEDLTVKIDGGSVQTFTFPDVAFVNAAAATAQEVVDKINASITGAVASVSADDKITITSHKVGSGSTVQVTGGSANAILAFDTDPVSGTAGTGYLVTAVDYTEGAADITITPGIVSIGDHDAGVAFLPWAPAHTTSGTRISGGQAEVDIDGETFHVTEYKIGIDTGRTVREGEATTVTSSGVAKKDRRVTVEITCLGTIGQDGTARLIDSGWFGQTHAISLRIGPDVATQRCTLSIGSIRFQADAIPIPESEETMITIKGVARMTTTSGDEFSALFD